MKTTTMPVRDIAYIGLFVALIATLSQMSVPLPGGVPMTLQTFAIPLAGVVLGAKRGALAALVYVLLGAFGAPVFAGFRGGFPILVGPTGGFILSFPIMAFVVGLAAEKRCAVYLAAGLLLGSAINLGLGMTQFAVITNRDLQTAFMLAVAPFIIIEALKMGLVFVVGPILRKGIDAR